MKNNEPLNHDEIIEGLTLCFRELVATEVSHRNMPNIINRGKAVAGIVTAAHREEIMENKRRAAEMALDGAEARVIKRLKPKK